jgi:type I restriction enzyme, S subunit
MNNSQLPEGYKQTEVGVIPEDWKVQSVSDSFEIKNNLRLPINRKVRESMEGQYPYYGPTNVQGYINEYRVEGEHALIGEDGDHFLKWRDLSMTLLVDGKFNVNNHAHIVKGVENLTSWFYYFFSHKELTTYLTRQGAGRYKLTKNALENIPCVIPPLTEQRAIAQALSDMDALIASLDKLIAKKRYLKTATMQQLLTGKKRLPGFGEGQGYKQTEVGVIPENWNVRCLGEVGQSLIGLTYRPEDTRDYGTLVLRSSNVQNDRLAYENNVYVDSTLPLPSRVIVEEGDILICVRNGSKQLIGKCALIDAEAAGSAFGAFMSVFRTKISGFVFYQFQSDVIQMQINEIMGATINQITNKDMAAFQIPLPPSDEEQRAIATVLSDMDTEITALETRRAKTQAIKQGMMQELLTGRTRLV